MNLIFNRHNVCVIILQRCYESGLNAEGKITVLAIFHSYGILYCLCMYAKFREIDYVELCSYGCFYRSLKKITKGSSNSYVHIKCLYTNTQ